MTCWHPLAAYRSTEKTSTGKPAITFNPLKSIVEGSSFSVPCGRCAGCRLDKAREMAIRCHHEAQMHPANAFLTLSYRPEDLPDNLSVDLRTFQLFMKRLRERLAQKIRFYGCGEYSDTDYRPHYHVLVFNFWPKDAKFLKYTERGDALYTSQFCDDVWGLGHVFIGAVTYQSAGYVARYVMKKQTGDFAVMRYARLDPEGRSYLVEPEFATGSRRPGIGATWFDKFKSDCFPSDFLIIEGNKVPVPRFYTSKLKEVSSSKEPDYEGSATQIKRYRAQKAAVPVNRANNTPARLRVREAVQASRISQLKRSI